MKIQTFLKREMRSLNYQLLIFIFCSALSVISLVSLGSFDVSTQNLISSDVREAAGGDIILRSRKAFEEPAQTFINSLNSRGVESSSLLEFSSIVSNTQNETLFAQIKVIEDNYPLYGDFVYDESIEYDGNLPQAAIDSQVATLITLSLGETLTIGNQDFVITQFIQSDPRQSGEFFTQGRTIYISNEDSELTGLIGTRSRISYFELIKVNSIQELETLELEANSVTNERERVQVASEFSTSTQRFLNEFLFFLNLISMFTLLLAGLGMSFSLLSYFRVKQSTLAILKSLGVKNRELLFLYGSGALLLGFVGMILGSLLGYVVVYSIPELLSEFLPDEFVPIFSFSVLMKTFLFGFLITLVFSLYPLLRMSDIKPLTLLRNHNIESSSRKLEYGITGLVGLLLFGFIFLELDDISLGIYFTLGILLAISFFAAVGILVKRFFLKIASSLNLELKLSLKGLFRAGGSFLLSFIALSLALTLLFTLSLVSSTLEKSFLQSYPEDLPNVFFVDIQKDQSQAFKDEFNGEVPLYATIRGGLLSYNGKSINQIIEESNQFEGRDLSREFALTYGSELNSNEMLLESYEEGRIHVSNWDKEDVAQVSVMKSWGDQLGIQLGDQLVFSIQGFELKAEVVSLRERREQRVEPFFYFIFEEEVLEDAPQTFFSATFIPNEEIGPTLSRLAKKFPTVTPIDITQIIKETSRILNVLTSIISFFTSFSLLAGILLFASSLFATRDEREEEAFYLKIQGFKPSQITLIFLYEFMILLGSAFVVAFFISQLAVYLIVTQILNISFIFSFVEPLVITLGLCLIILGVGYAILRSILFEKPLDYLRKR